MAQKALVAMAPKALAAPLVLSIPCDGHGTIGGTQRNGRWTKDDQKLELKQMQSC
jgi:hypothetical protein